VTQTRRLTPSTLAATLRADLSTLEARTLRAARRTADVGRLIPYSKAPVAFGELRDGLVSEDRPTGAAIVATAPHSASVEVGSRPHMPPLAPILAWVILRGAQGLDAAPSAKGAPAVIAGRIARRGNGTSTPVDAAERVARAIQHAIAKRGTRPTWFMRDSVAEVYTLFDAFMRSSLLDEAL
jgi:hypothetical protein